jgi:hypothetical protein
MSAVAFVELNGGRNIRANGLGKRLSDWYNNDAFEFRIVGWSWHTFS